MGDNQGTQDKDRMMREAKLALKTGLSAFANENYKLAEPLFIKALDLFEQCETQEDADFFQCLVSLADTYYYLRRYYEAKGYYERLSASRLKHSESSDAQVVVALLKLAATHEKLTEVDDALATFELTLELAEKTIPRGHALFGIIFDSYEILVERHVTDPESKEAILASLKEKREQFGFTESMSGIYRALPSAEEAQSSVGRLLAQPAEDIRKNLSAWTHTEISTWANEVRVQRARSTAQGMPAMSTNILDGPLNQAPTGSSETAIGGSSGASENRSGDSYAPSTSALDHKPLHLSVDMFRKSAREAAPELVVPEDETGKLSATDNPQLDTSTQRKAISIKRVDPSSRRLPNLLPALSAIFAVSIVCGAVYLAREYTKFMFASSVSSANGPGLDFTGKVFTSSDRKRIIRFLTRSTLELTDHGVTITANYHIKGEKRSSPLSEFFSGSAKTVGIGEADGVLTLPDGGTLYADNAKERLVLDKMSSVSSCATYYYAGHAHVYPSVESEFNFGNNSFSWDNPITPGADKPLVQKVDVSQQEFDGQFARELGLMRDLKSRFPIDDAAKIPPGLIECISIGPSGAVPVGGEGGASSGFLVRGYDSKGQLIRGSDPSKAYVIALKGGVSIDPLKVIQSPESQPKLINAGENIDFEMAVSDSKVDGNVAPAGADSKEPKAAAGSTEPKAAADSKEPKAAADSKEPQAAAGSTEPKAAGDKEPKAAADDKTPEAQPVEPSSGK